MKKCPYCAEEIQDEAIKCKHCGEFLGKKEKEKWYFKTSLLILAFLCVGPLALPFLWLNPRFSRGRKTVITIIVVILTYYLAAAAVNSLRGISVYYKTMFNSI